ncbi:MAG: hypothetical protein K6E27_13640 [Eubacterium sp.]|nr:hypothetical protein [Eubacterium sp.]
MKINSVIAGGKKTNMKKYVLMILVACLLSLSICVGNKDRVYAMSSVSEMGVEGGESDSGDSGESSGSGSASTSGYSEEQIAAAKAWLSAHGYAPTRAGAAAAYQDYLDGKFDDDPDVQKYKGQTGSTSETSSQEVSQEVGTSSSDVDTVSDKSSSDVDAASEKTSDETGSSTVDSSSEEGSNVTIDDLPSILVDSEDGSVDAETPESAGNGLKINDDLKLSERDDSVYVFYDDGEPEQVVRESGFVIYIIFSVVIVMVIVSLVMLIKARKKNDKEKREP